MNRKIEYKIDKLVEEATRFAKEFQKSNPDKKKDMLRTIAPSTTRSKKETDSMDMLMSKKDPSTSLANNFLRSSRDNIDARQEDKRQQREKNLDEFKNVKDLPYSSKDEQRDNLREMNFGFTRNQDTFDKLRDNAFNNQPYERYTKSPSESLKENNSKDQRWTKNLEGLYKNNPAEKSQNIVSGIKDKFANRNKPEFPFDTQGAATGGGLYTLDSLLNKRNTNTFNNQIGGSIWGNAAPSNNPKADTKDVKDHYNASKYGTYTDRATWDIPANATYNLPIEDRKHTGGVIPSPTEFTINKNGVDNISNLKINRVAPEEQRDKGVFLDREWSKSNNLDNQLKEDKVTPYDNAYYNLPNNERLNKFK